MTKDHKPISVEPIVIFIASSTPEKVRDLQLVAETKNIPIIFEDYNKLMGAFHHADEIGGNYGVNVEDKLKAIDVSHFKTTEKHRIENYFKDRGLPNTLKMYVATEDGGFALLKEVWDMVDKDGIPESALSKIKPGHNPAYSGPGSETAPVMSATFGEYNLMGRVQKAIMKLGKKEKDVSVMQNAEIRLKPIWNVENPEIVSFGAEKITYLHKPRHEVMADNYKNNKGKISNYHYSKTDKDSDKSIIDLGIDGITQHSVRSVLVDKLYNHFFAEEIKHGYKPSYTHPYKEIINEGHIYKIGAFGTGEAQALASEIERLAKNPKLGKGYTPSIVTSPHKPDRNRDRKTYLESSYDILSQIEKTMANSDSIILLPDTIGGNKKTESKEEIEHEKLMRLIKIYMISSLDVNKQLNSRDARKSIIIMNHDGSWNDAIAIHNNHANIGITKDFAISFPTKLSDHDKADGISINSNSYYDVVGTPSNGKNYSYQQTLDAAIELLHINRKGYNPRTPSKSPKFETGSAPDNFQGYKVAVFCSAGNENKYLNESVKELTYKLAKKKFGIIYGGGDRFTMGAVLDGVNEYRLELVTGSRNPELTGKTEQEKQAERRALIEQGKARNQDYIAGYSTKQILKSETKYGVFAPALNYAKQNHNIYQRMADMLENSDAVLAAPGGAGTVQEWAAALILNHSRPKDQQKPVVFYNPELNTEKIQVWNVALKAVLGEKDYNLLTSKNTALTTRREARCKELGIYIETTEKGVRERLSELRKEHLSKTEPEFDKSSRPRSFVEAYGSRQPSIATGISPA